MLEVLDRRLVFLRRLTLGSSDERPTHPATSASRVPHLRDGFTVAKVGSALPKAVVKAQAEATELPSSTPRVAHSS
jgi:hypothetical protein